MGRKGTTQRKLQTTVTLPDGSKRRIRTQAGLKRRRMTPKEKAFAAEKKLVDEAKEKLNGHGGARPKSGTKPKLIENLVRTGIDPPTARKLLDALDLYELNFRFAHNRDDAIAVRWVESLLDRVWGKAIQPSAIAFADSQRRPYADWTHEELDASIKELVGKLGYETTDPTPVAALPPASTEAKVHWTPPPLDFSDKLPPRREEPEYIPPPEPAEPEYVCVKHGKHFRLKGESMCPSCIREGLRDRDYLGAIALRTQQ